MSKSQLSLSVIVPARNAEATLGRVLPVWKRPGHGDCELTVVDDASTDGTAERKFLSQFKNLLHHYVHQNAAEEAGTFWAGCGAVRKKAFLDAVGFSEAYTLPSIEDVELGYRLKASGKTIRLLKALQVTHLKRWPFAGLIRSDIAGRAIP
jgi:hypothetical protein